MLELLAVFNVARHCRVERTGFGLLGMVDDGVGQVSEAATSGVATGAPSAARVVGQPVAAPRPETLRLYTADWSDFVAWCRVNRCCALPASAEVLAGYLLAIAPALRRGSLGRRRAAIGSMHRQHGYAVPALDAGMRAALRRTTRPGIGARRAAPTASTLTRWALRCPRDLAGLRDRSLLLLAATLLRPRGAPIAPAAGDATGGRTPHAGTQQALLGLQREQIRFNESGMIVAASGSEAGRLAAAVTIARTGTNASCAVRAMEDWLHASDTSFGPVFRKVDRWGNVEHAGLGPDGVRRIVLRRSGTAPGRA